MKLDELIQAFQNGATAQNELLTQRGLTRLQAYLGTQMGKLRLFVASGAGFEQQASTVTLLHRFISLGYAGKIEVIYDTTSTAGTQSTIQKLAVLLPGLNPDNPQPLTVDGAEVSFFAYIDKTPVAALADDPQPLCVSGGTAATTNLAPYFNVTYYLQLQPYQWTTGRHLLWEWGVPTATDLTQVAALGGPGQFVNRAFYTSAPALSPADWARLAKVPGIDPDMLARAQLLLNAAGTATPVAINFMPVSGLYAGTGPRRLAAANLDIVVALIASVAVAYGKGSLPQQVTVISLLDSFTGAEDGFWRELTAFFDSLDQLAEVDYNKLDFNEKKLFSTKKWLKDKGITRTRVKLLSGSTAAELQQQLQQAPANSLLLTYLPAPPLLLFNSLYRVATLPGVLDGAGAVNLALNLGKPYFQLAPRGQVPYPSRLLAAVAEAVPSDISERLANLQFGVYGDAAQAFGAVAQLLRDCLTPSSAQYQYFADLGAFYHQDPNDKLLLALLYWLQLMAPAANPLELSAQAVPANGVGDDDPLQALYDKLTANLANGTLSLIPGALKSGTLVNYLSGLVGGLKLTLTEVTLSPPAGPVTPDTVITVKGNAASFTGMPLPLTVTFALDEDGTGIDAVPALTMGTLELPGVPWFALHNTGIAVTVPGNGDRLTGQARLGLQLGEQQIDLVSDFPTADNQVLLTGTFGSTPPSIDRVLQLLGGVNFLSTLPDGLRAPSTLSLQRVQLAYDYQARAINAFNLKLKTTKSWPIIGKLSLDELLFDVVVTDPVNSRQVAWSASSALLISGKPGDKAGKLTIAVAYPGLSLTGRLADDSAPIPVGDLLTFFLPGQVTLNLGATLTSCSLYVVPGQDGGPTTLQASATLDTPTWNVKANGITFGLTNLGVEISNGEAGTTGKLTATTVLFQNEPTLEPLTFDLNAEYLGKTQGWQFSGRQVGNAIKIKQLLAKYVDASWGSSAVPNVEVSDLAFDITAGADGDDATAKAYAISGKVGLWETPLGSAADKRLFKSTITAKLGYGGEKKGRYGYVKAAVSWHNINLLLGYDFDPVYQAFSITWNGLVGKIEEKLIDGKKHQRATLTFTDAVTLGSIIETCVSWATGTKFGLAAPWNILDEVSFSGLALTYDFTDKTVQFDVKINPIELGFARLEGLAVSYQSGRSKPEENGVLVTIKGSFRWQDDPNKPLGWDAAKPETTPAPPGQGNKYLDLRLLALGQHVALGDLKNVNKVQDAIALMAKDLPEPEPASGQLALPAVTLDPDSSWLVGMDFGVLRLEEEKKPAARPALEVMRLDDVEDAVYLPEEAPAPDTASYFLTLQIVFNDPNLYALRLALNGAPAKIFKGLDFQILYKKVSDTVGVYMAEIALPDVMRQIKLGTVNLTLPVFAIQVYTNGDFLVDIGFPWNQDFSRSLTFQALIITPVGIPIPVMGSAGLYFGKLSSATTDRVPKSQRGTFNPVLVFGFGLQFGLGYSFEAGILKAGFSLTAVAILEGILAKWNPYELPAGPADNTQLETAYYFWFRGTVGLMGKLYGSVDFAIIKAELNIGFSIIAQLTFAPYEPILLSITVTVDVGLTVTINLGLFKINISFSFSARISQSVTIQAIGGRAPWADGTPRSLLGQPLRTRQLPPFAVAGHQSLPLRAPSLAWNNLLKPDTPAPLRGYLGLGLTMAGDAATTLADQVACYVSMLFLESVGPPQADALRCTYAALEDKRLADTDTSFEQLCKMLFRWLIAAQQPAPLTSAQVDECLVSEEQLKQLLAYLSNRDNPIPLASADLEQFLANQFVLTIAVEQTAGHPDATYFPVPNALSFAVPAYGAAPALAYSYGNYNELDASYISQIAERFDELAVQQAKASGAPLVAGRAGAAPSMGSFVFSDYFLLLCRQMVQAGRDALRDFKYFLRPGDTPATIVEWARTNGQAGYALSELFADNATVALNVQADHLTIAGSHYLVQAGDTFASIARQARYGSAFEGKALAQLNSAAPGLLQAGSVVQYAGQPAYHVPAGYSLKELAEDLRVSVTDLLDKSNVLTLNNLLLPTVPLAVPDFGYAIASGDTLRSIAAGFGLKATDLAAPAANAQLKNLFAESVRALDLVELQQFSVGAILQEIQATQGLQHLAGMTSRYYMAGLRLPTQGIKPLHAGMWVTPGPNDTLVLPPAAGLYALTGQQFVLPSLTAGAPLALTYTSAASWLRFKGATPQQTVVSIEPDSLNAQQLASVRTFATQNRLDVGTTYLGAGGTFQSAAATFPFTSAITWSSAATLAMPYGGAPAGLPSLKLWQLPDTLLELPAAGRAVNPRVELLAGHYDSATGTMQNSPLNHYGYATVVDFTIKKIPVVSTSPATQTTYEIAGADGTNAELLEKIVAGVGTDDSQIASLFVAYSPGATAATPPGIQTDDPQRLTIGVAQVNLSTDTHPGQTATARRVRGEEAGPQLLNTPTGLLTLLWEASITRSGGFYLYYYNDETGAGLPDSIFNSSQEATLRLVVLYARPAAATAQNRVPNYLNALATAEALDTTSAVLFAQASPEAVTLSLTPGQDWTLAQLAYRYFGNVADVATDNQTQPLQAGRSLRLTEGVYEVGPAGRAPGGSLPAIAAHFGTTVEAIKQANPLRQDWPPPAELPLFTSLRLPPLTITVGTSPGGSTLAALATYYGQNLAALAAYNQDVAGLFADSATLHLAGGPTVRTATVPAGVVALEAVRPVPHLVPDSPADPNFGRYFLQNNFSLLNYQLVENETFRASPLGLPAGPTSPAALGDDKIRAPRTLAPNENWVYSQSIPYSRFAKQKPRAVAGLPAPAASPYQGLGSLLKVNFSWQDYYGNCLLTTLAQPQAGDAHPVLNQPPVLTGYTDALLALSQWPAVSAGWQVRPVASQPPLLEVRLDFDSSPYQGLNRVVVTDSQTVVAYFTLPLDPASATQVANYALVQQAALGGSERPVEVSKVVLSPDLLSVTLTVGHLQEGAALPLSLTIGNISSADKGLAKQLSFSGVAKFSYAPDAPPSQTPVSESATRDQLVYGQLWYQLTDPNGIQFSVSTDLLQRPNVLTAEQAQRLLDGWLAPIYLFLADRAGGGTTVAPPVPTHELAFPIDLEQLNSAQIFRLELAFGIERTGGAVAGDFETTGGIKQVRTTIAPLSTKAEGSASYSFDAFAQQLEAALHQPGRYALRVATGTDRTANNRSAGGRALWAVRHDESAGLGYQITNAGQPHLFAPAPISNKLEGRTQVPIYDFDPKTGINFTKHTRLQDFAGIDMDVWGRQFFTAIDQVLAPEYTAAIQLIDAHRNTHYYTDLLSYKTQLANSVKDWLMPVFREASAPNLTAVREAFRQLLLVQLGNAYTTSAAVQFGAEVAAQVPPGIAPRLYGALTPNFRFLGAALNAQQPRQLNLFFSSELNADVAESLANYTLTPALQVQTATLDPVGRRQVTLTLSGPAIVGTTQVALAATLRSSSGQGLLPPQSLPVTAHVAAGNYSTAVSLTSAKLELTPTQLPQQQPLAFLITSPQVVKAPDGAVIPYLDLDLTYAGSQLEHQVANLENISGYQASSWLNFLTAAGTRTFAADLGKFSVPLLLRTFPTPPAMLMQEGRVPASDAPLAGPVDFATLLNWDYYLTYAEPFHFPQDRLSFTVNFNVLDRSPRTLTRMADAFGELAEFTTVFPQVAAALATNLAGLSAVSTEAQLLVGEVGLKAFDELVGRVVTKAAANGLRLADQRSQRGSNEALPYAFDLQESIVRMASPVPEDPDVEALVVSLSTKAPDDIIPSVEIENCHTHAYTGSEGPTAAYAFYFTDCDTGAILSAAEGQQKPKRTVVLRGLNILQRQDAETVVELKRNVEPIPGRPSADAFVYTTGPVSFSDKAHPTISQAQDIDISTLPDHPATHNNWPLAQQLTNLLDTLLLKNTQPTLYFQLSCSYLYSLGPGLSHIELPVLLQPLTQVQVQASTAGPGEITRAQLVADLAGGLKYWCQAHQPSPASAAFRFDLTLFSNLTQHASPLLRLANLMLPVQYISDLPKTH